MWSGLVANRGGVGRVACNRKGVYHYALWGALARETKPFLCRRKGEESEMGCGVYDSRVLD